jgi:chorismate mutase/prephenate dehydratase
MNRIESRPSHQALWEYVFFIDIDGHCHDDQIRSVLESIKQRANTVKVLGSYPKAVL